MDDGQRQVFFTAGDGLGSPDAKSNSPDDVNLENWEKSSQPSETARGENLVSAGQGIRQNLGQNALFGAGVFLSENMAHENERQAIFSGAGNVPERLPMSADLSRNLGATARNTPLSEGNQLGSGSEQMLMPEVPADSLPINFRQESILTEGDRLSGAAYEEVRKLEGKLGRDGDIASFYDDIRDAAKANLEHSFGRRVGQ